MTVFTYPFVPAALLALIVLEGFALAGLHVATGRGLPLGALAPNLAAGAFLLAAWAVMEQGGAGVWIAACLTGSLLAHLADLRRRWR